MTNFQTIKKLENSDQLLSMPNGGGVEGWGIKQGRPARKMLRLVIRKKLLTIWLQKECHKKYNGRGFMWKLL